MVDQVKDHAIFWFMCFQLPSSRPLPFEVSWTLWQLLHVLKGTTAMYYLALANHQDECHLPLFGVHMPLLIISEVFVKRGVWFFSPALYFDIPFPSRVLFIIVTMCSIGIIFAFIFIVFYESFHTDPVVGDIEISSLWRRRLRLRTFSRFCFSFCFRFC